MTADKKYEPIKESRGWYFVEYYPPQNGYRFATLQLIITTINVAKNDIVNAMEKELGSWLRRYPIPLMVSAFDNSGSLYKLDEVKPCNHLIGFLDQSNEICLHWRLLTNDELPDIALNQEYVENLYSALAYKTYVEIDTQRRTKRQKLKIGWIIFFIWLVVIPLTIAILEYYSSFLSLVAVIFSFCMAIKKGLELSGKWPKSKREKEQEQENRLKDHYYYHCQKNPEGFKKLMLENMEKMSKDEITKEAEALKTKKTDIFSSQIKS